MRRFAAHAAAADHRHAPVARRVLVVGEHGPGSVEAEKQRLATVELGEWDELQPVLDDPQPAVAGHDGAGARVLELRREPINVPAPRIAHPIERGARKSVLHPPHPIADRAAP